MDIVSRVEWRMYVSQCVAIKSSIPENKPTMWAIQLTLVSEL